MNRLVRILALGSALVLPALAGAAEQASYDFRIGGFKVGVLTMGLDESGSSYTATSRIDTVGVVGMFADFYFDGKASGSVSGRKVVPGAYAATSKSPRALRQTRIDWKGGVPVMVSVEPPRSTAPTPSEQGGTLDPVSAGFKLFRTAPREEVCNTIVDVFDGSRRSQLRVGQPQASGEELVCNGTFVRIAGEAHSAAERREFPFKLVFAPAGDGRFQMQRIEAPTNYGQAVIARQ